MRSADMLKLCLGALFAASFSCALYAAQPLPEGCTPPANSNIGCDFFAVSLPNTLLDQTTFSFGVQLLNLTTSTANVSISGGGLALPDSFTIASASSASHALPWVSTLSMSTATSKIAAGAYRIATSQPVSALQLNPTSYVVSGSVFSQSNDASLLLPVKSAGTAYRVVTSPTWNNFGSQAPGHFAVVGTTVGTTVTIAAAGTILPGAGLSANGGSAVLDAGDVLLVSSALNAPMNGYGADLSGTLITSTAPVLVWSGHTGTNVPAGTAFADHLEEIQPPISALGDDYVIVRPGNPSSGSQTGARHMVKLVGAVNGTILTTDPFIAGAPGSLQAGQASTFEATVDFHLHANQPLAVALFMEGGQTTGFNGAGDPSQSIAIPTSQARRSLDFLTPSQLGPWYAQVVAPANAKINVDGSAVSGWTPISGSGYSVALVALSALDVHHAAGNRPFTLSVYSYPTFTSYWYPASLGLGDIIFADSFL